MSSSFSESALNKYVTPTQKAAPVIPILIVVVIKRSVILDIQDQTPFFIFKWGVVRLVIVWNHNASALSLLF